MFEFDKFYKMKIENHNKATQIGGISFKVRYLIHFGFWSVVCTLVIGVHLFKYESGLWAKSEYPGLMLLGYALFFGLCSGAILAIFSYKSRNFS